MYSTQGRNSVILTIVMHSDNQYVAHHFGLSQRIGVTVMNQIETTKHFQNSFLLIQWLFFQQLYKSASEIVRIKLVCLCYI